MSPAAVAALRELDVPAHRHRSRRLISRMCQQSAAVYCMTEDLRAAVAELAPATRDRTFRLDPAADIVEPGGSGTGSYHGVALQIRHAVRQRVREQVALAAAQSPAGG
jgi:protein-tyrosine-phosphatase